MPYSLATSGRRPPPIPTAGNKHENGELDPWWPHSQLLRQSFTSPGQGQASSPERTRRNKITSHCLGSSDGVPGLRNMMPATSSPITRHSRPGSPPDSHRPPGTGFRRNSARLFITLQTAIDFGIRSLADPLPSCVVHDLVHGHFPDDASVIFFSGQA